MKETTREELLEKALRNLRDHMFNMPLDPRTMEYRDWMKGSEAVVREADRVLEKRTIVDRILGRK